MPAVSSPRRFRGKSAKVHTSGRIQGLRCVAFVLEREGGRHETVELSRPGSFVLVPRGTWHTARTDEPTRMLSVTDGEGTTHRPAAG